MQLTLKEQIICHINYRDVFNAPVERKALGKWLPLRNSQDRLLVDSAIEDLKKEKLIIESGGYLAVPGKSFIIDNQRQKRAMTIALLNKGDKMIRLFSRIPFIRYVGVSGSVAAGNPTLDRRDHVDLDLFVISSTHSLWMVFLVERIITNLIRFFRGDHFYCFNYVTEENFLEIHNQNFFTATEIINLKTLRDKGVYDRFLMNNLWIGKYYRTETREPVARSGDQSTSSLKPLNYFFYMLFCIFRGLKKLNLRYAFEFTSKFDPTQKCNLHRICNPNGGYQERIKDKFVSLMRSNFPDYYSVEMITFLFPGKSCYDFSTESNSHDLLIANQFEKYT